MSHLPFSSFKTPVSQLLPDSLYSLCAEDTNSCDVCHNQVWSPVVNGMVHDTQRGKVFCPFGVDGSMNQNIFNDQSTVNYSRTTWGMAPQMEPRSLAKIGLYWRTS